MTASAHFSASLMSDAKWRKFFHVAAENAEVVFAATWKLIDEPEPVSGHLPDAEDIWDTAVDGCLNSPVEYKRIEWIEVPRSAPFRRYPNAPLAYRSQDLERFRLALDSVAQFPLEDTLNGLLVRAYAR